MVRRAGLAAVLMVVAALAGCATPVETVGGPGTVGLDDVPYGQSCDSDSPDLPESSLPPEESLADGAHLTLATRCVFTTETVPGDGEWSVRQDQQATSGLDALAAALRLPSGQPGGGAVCPAIGYVPIVITVTDDTGRSFRPAIPHEACGAPLKAATDAIAALPWTTTARTRVQQVRTELEVTSGCPGAYKPVVAMAAAEALGPGTPSIVDTTGREQRACRYEPDLDDDMLDMSSGVGLHVGRLTAASTVDAAIAHDLLVAVAAARAAGPGCPEAPYVVLSGKSGGGPGLTVEVGGCYRVLYDGDGGYVRQLDAGTVSRLLG